MEANFGIFFGLAVQLYESTLISDDCKIDRFLEGSAALTLQEQRGMQHFIANCIACHSGPETTDVSVWNIQGADPITGVPQPLTKNPLATSEFMSFMVGTGLYDNGFHNHGSRPGGNTNPLAGDYVSVNEDTGRGGRTELPAPLENFPICWGEMGLRDIGFLTPRLPTWLTPYVPPLPPGFRPVDTFPWRGREGNAGAFKTPGMRNVELTGPYMHNGGLSTLHQVVEFYARGGDFPFTNQMNFDPAVLPLGLLLSNDTRKNELVAFLIALTDERVRLETAPFDRPEIFIPIDGRAPVSPDGTREGFLTLPNMYRRIPEVGAGGRPAGDNDGKALPPLGTFLNLSPFSP
jgi:cytochrome c peroxidase